MKKIIIAGVAILLLGGGAAYFITKGDNIQSENSTPTNTAADTATTPTNFSPVSTEGLDFIATITTNSKTGTTTAKFEQDGSKSRYTLSANGTESQFIYTQDAYYACTGEECFKYALSQSSSTGVDVKSYAYTKSELTNLKSSASYQGKKDCPAGSCDVWTVTTAGITSTLYVDAQTNRISQVETSQGDTTTKLAYEYKDVSIAVPKNAKTFPATP